MVAEVRPIRPTRGAPPATRDEVELATLWREAPMHAWWWGEVLATGGLTAGRCVVDARWMLRVCACTGERLPSVRVLAERWQVTEHRVRQLLEAARGIPLPRLRLAELQRALRGRARARARVLQLGLERHDAWLEAQVQVDGRGRRLPVAREVAVVDLDVVRWRAREGLGPEPTLELLAGRWGWAPRAGVQPLLEEHTSRGIPAMDHLGEVRVG